MTTTRSIDGRAAARYAAARAEKRGGNARGAVPRGRGTDSHPQARVLGRRGGRAAARFVRGGSGHGLFHAALRRDLARRYGLGGVHLRGERIAAGAGKGLRRSCSTHGWDEVERYGPVARLRFPQPVVRLHIQGRISQRRFAGRGPLAVAAERGARRRAGRSLRGKYRMGPLGRFRRSRVARRRLGHGGRPARYAGYRASVPEAAPQVAGCRGMPSAHIGREHVRCRSVSARRRALGAASHEGYACRADRRPGPRIARAVPGMGRSADRQRRAGTLCRDRGRRRASRTGRYGARRGSPYRRRRSDCRFDGQYVRADRRALRRADRLYRPRSVPLYDDQNLAPVLGAEGYRSILERMRREGIALPVVAIGGILPEDVPG